MIKKPIPAGTKKRLSLNVTFRGKEQLGFFDFRRIAEGEPFNMDATSFARLVLLDFVREWGAKIPGSKVRRERFQQLIITEGKRNERL